MSLTDIVESAGWKNFMSKLYGMGATIVIIGALFKINHWPGGALWITAGMSIEAVIFFFSSFEPLHEELDWTLVYPELAGMSDPDELEDFKARTLGNGERTVESIEQVMAGGGLAPAPVNQAIKQQPIAVSQQATEAMKSFKAGDMPDILAAAKATKKYTENIEKAADAVSGIDEAYANSVQKVNESAESLNTSYLKTAETITRSGSEIASVYKNVATNISSGTFSIIEGSKNYQDNLEKLNNNLHTLNTVYEEQIKDSNDHLKGTQELYSGLSEMMNSLKSSIDETVKYKEEMSKLKSNISSLNMVYGNMLQTVEETTKKKNS